MADDYGGFAGALLWAFRRSDSYLLRAYVVVAALVGAFVAVLLLLGAVTWLATPAPIGQRALLGVIAILVLVPLFAPVLVVARRHRYGAAGRRADALLGLTGFGFVLAVYLALLVSDPNPHGVSGPLAPAVAAVDALPRRYWVVPPVCAAVSIWLAVRVTRSSEAPGGEEKAERTRLEERTGDDGRSAGRARTDDEEDGDDPAGPSAGGPGDRAEG